MLTNLLETTFHGLEVLTRSMETTCPVLKGNLTVPYAFCANETQSGVTAFHEEIYLVLLMKSEEAKNMLSLS